VIEEILPASVASAEAFGDEPDAQLWPEERSVVERAIEARQLEFATGRACARSALSRFGVPAVAIVAGAGGEPRWPAGIVGSITHCGAYRAAAVGRREDVGAVGIDAEPHSPLPDNVLDSVASEDDQAAFPASADLCWDRVLFSAKEAVFKAWYPLTKSWLGFEDVRLVISASEGTFTAGLRRARRAVDGRRLIAFEGRWVVRNGLVLTAVVVPA
jgi:4'-phosphopantetheinyl transferase EntD